MIRTPMLFIAGTTVRQARRRLRSSMVAVACALVIPALTYGQDFPVRDSVLPTIWRLGMIESKALDLAQVLSDSIGPRLTGSPGARAGHAWLGHMYREWGISVRDEPYGTWTGWRREAAHLDLISPHFRTLVAYAGSWSAATPGPVEGPVIMLPAMADSVGFSTWLPQAAGAFVLLDGARLSCRPDRHFEEFGGPGALDAARAAQQAADSMFRSARRPAGLTNAAIAQRLAEAGALGILRTNWQPRNAGPQLGGLPYYTYLPVMVASCEDYGLLFRLAQRNQGPRIRAEVRATYLDRPVGTDAGPAGTTPTMNTIAEIAGWGDPKEYILLSAHLDSWEGGSGATDNALGTAIVMEVMRILKEVYPNPRRTILAGHWSGEEQGMNGSRAWAESNRPVVDAIHAGFNIDLLVGRPSAFHLQGLTRAGEYVARWLARMPEELTEGIPFMNPSLPTRGGHDAASFICSGAPVFHFVSQGWDVGFAQHTTVDTFDKIIPEELRRNATFFAMLVYLADQDAERMPRDRRVMPDWEGSPMTWPECRSGVPAWR